MKLMLVESPNKVKKIEGILGAGWKVLASAGHIRDLPRHGDGIQGDNFELIYEFIPPTPIPGQAGKFFPGGEDRVKRIAHEARQAESVYIASDPDREGEAIAWHLKDSLHLRDAQYHRVTFTEITPDAIRKAVQAPRKIDMNLVRAQEARRALDRIVGYMVSPILSDMMGLALSAGRVQSPAVRIIVDREDEIAKFKVTDHFGARVTFDGGTWTADWNTAPFLAPDQKYVLDRALAERAAASRDFRVTSSKTTVQTEAPPSPFSTALLLRAASVALGFDPEYTAKLAQKLFEGGKDSDVGHITYIRTDSVNFSAEAVTEMRAYGQSQGWPLPPTPRRYKSKDDAQEAHEAIRPTHIEVMEAGDTPDERALYQLIWQRSMASQLADARYSVNTVELEASSAGTTFEFKAKGRVMLDKGWRGLTASDAADDPDAKDEEQKDWANGKVPALDVASAKRADSGQVVEIRTKPPKRYTKASLIEKLESCGIGRPATYPAIMSNIMGKGYLSEKKRFLYPTPRGSDLIATLVKGRFGFIELDFTRELEGELDHIAAGRQTYLKVVSAEHGRLKGEISGLAQSGALAARYPCPKCGKPLRQASRKGRLFWYCTGHADGCETFMDDSNGKPVPQQEHPCPKCQSPLRQYQKKATKALGWFCTNKDCKCFMDDEKGKPVPQKVHECAACQGPLRRYQKKDKTTQKPLNAFGWFCLNDACRKFYDDHAGKPILPQACPKCSAALRRYQKKDKQSGKPLREFGWFCPTPDCKTFMDDKAGKAVPQAPKGDKPPPANRAASAASRKTAPKGPSTSSPF